MHQRRRRRRELPFPPFPPFPPPPLLPAPGSKRQPRHGMQPPFCNPSRRLVLNVLPEKVRLPVHQPRRLGTKPVALQPQLWDLVQIHDAAPPRAIDPLILERPERPLNLPGVLFRHLDPVEPQPTDHPLHAPRPPHVPVRFLHADTGQRLDEITPCQHTHLLKHAQVPPNKAQLPTVGQVPELHPVRHHPVKLEQDPRAPVAQKVGILGEHGIDVAIQSQVRALGVGLVRCDQKPDVSALELLHKGIGNLWRDIDRTLIVLNRGNLGPLRPQVPRLLQRLGPEITSNEQRAPQRE